MIIAKHRGKQFRNIFHVAQIRAQLSALPETKEMFPIVLLSCPPYWIHG